MLPVAYKVALKTAWTYIKKYWAVFALVAGFILFKVWLGRTENGFADALDEIQKRHQKELEDLRRAQEQREREQRENVERMERRLAEITKQYEQAQRELDESKKAEIKKILLETQNDPLELARRLAEATGFTVVIPPEEL